MGRGKERGAGAGPAVTLAAALPILLTLVIFHSTVR